MYLCLGRAGGGGGWGWKVNIDFFKISGGGDIKSIVGGEWNNELKVPDLYQTKSHC